MHLAVRPTDCYVERKHFAGVEIFSICEEEHYFIPSLTTTYVATTILVLSAVVLVVGGFVAIKRLVTTHG